LAKSKKIPTDRWLCDGPTCEAITAEVGGKYARGVDRGQLDKLMTWTTHEQKLLLFAALDDDGSALKRSQLLSATFNYIEIVYSADAVLLAAADAVADRTLEMMGERRAESESSAS
jgi:hypothetical protein